MLLSLLMIPALSCSKKSDKFLNETVFPDYSTLTKEFEKELVRTIENLNQSGSDSISTQIERDTLYIFVMEGSDVYSGLGQYRTKDNSMKLGIIGIGNFRNEYPPTFVMLDHSAELFIADSSFISNDSLFVYGRIDRSSGIKDFQVGFDLNFDGTSFPWSSE